MTRHLDSYILLTSLLEVLGQYRSAKKVTPKFNATQYRNQGDGSPCRLFMILLFLAILFVDIDIMPLSACTVILHTAGRSHDNLEYNLGASTFMLRPEPRGCMHVDSTPVKTNLRVFSDAFKSSLIAAVSGNLLERIRFRFLLLSRKGVKWRFEVSPPARARVRQEKMWITAGDGAGGVE